MPVFSSREDGNDYRIFNLEEDYILEVSITITNDE